jgi:ATP-dependent DNA helicase RecG
VLRLPGKVQHLRTINLSWDFARDPNHDINDISLEKVNQFIENSNRFQDYPINDDPLTVLKKFELLRENAVSFGCFLLFCNNPSMISTIDAGRFDSETIIKDSITIRNDLFSEVEACMNFVRKHISKRFVISGKPQRDEIWEYPILETNRSLQYSKKSELLKSMVPELNGCCSRWQMQDHLRLFLK